MGKTHIIKILQKYENAKLQGWKPLEVLRNDQNYKVGDFVKYQVVNDNGENIKSPLSEETFMITFITEFMQRNDFIVFGEIKVS